MEEKHLPPALRTDNLREHIQYAGLEENKNPDVFAQTKAFLQDTHYPYIKSPKKHHKQSNQRLIFETLKKLLASKVEQIKTAAQKSIGDCYYYGYGVKKNQIQAVHWFQKAANQGNAVAQSNLGHCYRHGTGVEQNLSQAVHWFQKAANQGNAEAQNSLGYMFDEGIGVEQNLSQAVYWYQKAANQGNAVAQSNLGYCYQHGTGISQDPSRAVHWYLKAANQGYAAAHNNLGRCYNEGIGVSQDPGQAVYWYLKAARQGYAAAKVNLGHLLHAQAENLDPLLVKSARLKLGLLEAKNISGAKLIESLASTLFKCLGKNEQQNYQNYFVTSHELLSYLVQHELGSNTTDLSLLRNPVSRHALLKQLCPGSKVFERLAPTLRGLVQISLLSMPVDVFADPGLFMQILGPHLKLNSIWHCCTYLSDLTLLEAKDNLETAPTEPYQAILLALKDCLNRACAAANSASVSSRHKQNLFKLVKCLCNTELFSELTDDQVLRQSWMELAWNEPAGLDEAKQKSGSPKKRPTQR